MIHLQVYCISYLHFPAKDLVSDLLKLSEEYICCGIKYISLWNLGLSWPASQRVLFLIFGVSNLPVLRVVLPLKNISVAKFL